MKNILISLVSLLAFTGVAFAHADSSAEEHAKPAIEEGKDKMHEEGKAAEDAKKVEDKKKK